MAHHVGFLCFDCGSEVHPTNSVVYAHTVCSARVCHLCISVAPSHKRDTAAAAVQYVANTLKRRAAGSPNTIFCGTHLAHHTKHQDGLDQIDMLQRQKLAVHAVLDGEQQRTAAARYKLSTTSLSRAMKLVNGGRYGTERLASDATPKDEKTPDVGNKKGRKLFVIDGM